MATPMNSAKLVNGTSLVENRGYRYSASADAEHERQDDAGVRDGDGGVHLAAEQVGIELEADQEHVEDDAQLRDDAEERRHVRREDEADRPRARDGRAARDRGESRRRLRRSRAADRCG